MKVFREILDHLEVWVDGMIHPDARSDPFLEPLHRAFLFGCFLTGITALIVLPLHLALAGAPHIVAILALAWMFCQWPLAHYLSQSGDLDKAIGVSAGLFAVFLAGICLLTGGNQSFALLWLLVPPIEAAFAANRKVSIGVSGLCVGLYAALGLVSVEAATVPALPYSVQIISVTAVVLYAGILSFRIATDRNLARQLLNSAEQQQDMMAQCTSEVMCEITADDRIRVLGGPIRQILGNTHLPIEADWIFHRVNVADRPLYLSHLSEARHNATPASFEVRLRIGDTGSGGLAGTDYHPVWLELRPLKDEISEPKTIANTVLLSIRALDEQQKSARSDVSAVGTGNDGVISQVLLDRASDEIRVPLNRIVSMAERMTAGEIQHTSEMAQRVGDEIRFSGEQGLTALSSLVDLTSGTPQVSQDQSMGFDLKDCIVSCGNLMTTPAQRHGIELAIQAPEYTVFAICDQRLIKKSLCFALSDMIETAGESAQIKVGCEFEQDEISISVSIKSREKHWNLETAAPVLGHIRELLERAGGHLETVTALGNADSVVMRIPGQANSRASRMASEQIEASVELAKTA
ncbi:MAG: hypothetical protein ABJQ71_01710 [Roseibium sp.]